MLFFCKAGAKVRKKNGSTKFFRTFFLIFYFAGLVGTTGAAFWASAPAAGTAF